MEGDLESVEISTSDPFKLLVQSIVDYAIYMLDPKGFVTSWNAGAVRIKGFETEEIVGQHFSKFYTEEDREAGVPRKSSKPRARKASSRARGGAFERTAPASGRASLSTESMTKMASWSASPRSRAT